MNFEELRAKTIEKISVRVSEAAVALDKMHDSADTGSQKGYVPIIKEEPACPVTINEAMNIFLDLASAPNVTVAQTNYCQYLMVSIPGKNFCDGQWVVSSLEELIDPPTDFNMPVPGNMEQITGMDGDQMGNGTGSSGGGSGGPLVPANEGPDSGPTGSTL